MDESGAFQRVEDLVQRAWEAMKCHLLLKCRGCAAREGCPKDRFVQEAGLEFVDLVCSLLKDESLEEVVRNYFDKNYLDASIIQPVKGISMWPALKPGDLIILFPIDLLGSRVGEVVSYMRASPGDYQVVHRVVKVLGTGLVAKGDHNDVSETVPLRHVTKHLRAHIPTGSPLWMDLHRVFGDVILSNLRDGLKAAEEGGHVQIVRWIKRRIAEEEKGGS